MKLEEINKLIKDFEKSSLRELELKLGDVHLKLSKNEQTIIQNNVSENKVVENIKLNEVKEEKIEANEPKINMPENLVKSPLVGTFYAASDPNAKPFVSVGSKVKKGDVLCIIEAMKIMNEITSPFDGVVSKINYNNTDVVGFDDVLMVIENEHHTK